MSTASERLEAEIWLETTDANLSPEQRDAFFAAVDEYFDQHPTAGRGPNFLATLRQDDLAFTRLLNAITAGDDPTPTAALTDPDEQEPVPQSIDAP